MSKLTRLILLSTLLLNCCKLYNISIKPTDAQPHNRSKRNLNKLPNKTD
ncbi:hypothetical protein bpSLO_001444 (plasmid) [Borrelia parkeri]|nr:hypothetical protein [Borrelia parkeri]UPA11570.1 hypothetical protein bpSLO_001444 [Borrelia parkeri]